MQSEDTTSSAQLQSHPQPLNINQMKRIQTKIGNTVDRINAETNHFFDRYPPLVPNYSVDPEVAENEALEKELQEAEKKLKEMDGDTIMTNNNNNNNTATTTATATAVEIAIAAARAIAATATTATSTQVSAADSSSSSDHILHSDTLSRVDSLGSLNIKIESQMNVEPTTSVFVPIIDVSSSDEEEKDHDFQPNRNTGRRHATILSDYEDQPAVAATNNTVTNTVSEPIRTRQFHRLRRYPVTHPNQRYQQLLQAARTNSLLDDEAEESDGDGEADDAEDHDEEDYIERKEEADQDDGEAEYHFPPATTPYVHPAPTQYVPANPTSNQQPVSSSSSSSSSGSFPVYASAVPTPNTSDIFTPNVSDPRSAQYREQYYRSIR